MPVEITIEAIVHIKPESEGGHQITCCEQYRPHLVVPPSSEYLGVVFCNINAPEEPQTIQPGENARVFLAPIYTDTVNYDSLVEGAEFEIREGGKTVGTGTVTHRTERVRWTPEGRIVTADRLPFLCQEYSGVVVHCGAEWNRVDAKMNTLLQELRKEYSSRIQFHSMDFDDVHNWAFLKEANVINLPALIVFINGTRYETLIGMHSKEELLHKFEEWIQPASTKF